MTRDQSSMRNEYIVRPAVAADLPAIQTIFIQGDAYHAGLLPDVFVKPDPTHPARTRGYLDSFHPPDAVILVAETEGKVVGFASVNKQRRPSPPFTPHEFAYIDSMVVEETKRGQGIGTRLIEATKTWAIQQGLHSIQLNVWLANTEAVRLYESQGFRPLTQRMELNL